MNLDVI